MLYIYVFFCVCVCVRTIARMHKDMIRYVVWMNYTQYM